MRTHRGWTIRLAAVALGVVGVLAGAIGVRAQGAASSYLPITEEDFPTVLARYDLAAGTPIADSGVIVGKWTGTVTPGDEPFYLTINPGGTLTAAWGPNMAWGTVMVRNGQATFEMQPGPYEGSIRLYDNGGTRQIVLDDLWASFSARAVPQ